MDLPIPNLVKCNSAVSDTQIWERDGRMQRTRKVWEDNIKMDNKDVSVSYNNRQSAMTQFICFID
jgi:hypothetical protein